MKQVAGDQGLTKISHLPPAEADGHGFLNNSGAANHRLKLLTPAAIYTASEHPQE
jgi:hypothetical protein